MSTISTALSGLRAAELRLANSSNNIANVHSTRRVEDGEVVDAPYRPTDVQHRSIEPQAGVETRIVPREPASIPVYDPSHSQADAEGLVQYPNVSLDHEVAQTMIARHTFQANVKAIEAARDMDETLLDIKT